MADGKPMDAGAQYLFIVARDRPEIFARVKERLRDDPRIEIIVDRRHRERRTSGASPAVDRRRSERRRATKYWDDLSVYPTLVIPKRVQSYAEPQGTASASVREAAELREDNARVRAENARLREAFEGLAQQLHMLRSADTTFRTEAAEILSQAEQAVGAMIAKFEALTRLQQQNDGPPRARG